MYKELKDLGAQLFYIVRTAARAVWCANMPPPLFFDSAGIKMTIIFSFISVMCRRFGLLA